MGEVLLSTISWIVYIIGIISTLKVISILYRQVKALTTRLNSSWASKYGLKSWAVVTGCTQGIGKAFCFELAQLQFKLVLISRSEEKLQKLSHELWKSYPNLDVIIVVADFSQFSQKMYDQIYNKIDHIDISILVNNVGTAYTKSFRSQTSKEIQDIININIQSMTHLTSKLLPNMLQRKNRSAIINLSSYSIHCPFKNLTVYAATKAYNDIFSRCLAEEQSKKIDVISSRPCIVSTHATNNTKDPLACTAQQCVRGTLKALGKSKVTSGHWSHFLQTFMASILGEEATRWFGNLKLDQLQEQKTK